MPSGDDIGAVIRLRSEENVARAIHALRLSVRRYASSMGRIAAGARFVQLQWIAAGDSIGRQDQVVNKIINII